MKTVCISGGFDPLHIGHLRYIEAAKKIGTLWIILNDDKFLLGKKGYIFMPFEQRREILESIIGVERVIKCIDTDNTVCKTLLGLSPDIFCKGGDRTRDNIPEVSVCEELGIEMMFGVGGDDKPQSSSWLIDNLFKQIIISEKLRRRFNIDGKSKRI